MLGVEDNPVNLLLLREVIEIIGGCQLMLAPDGESALEMAHKHRPNVMASDLGWPQMDGLALVQAIRADAALNGMRCIALSGDAPAESRGRALQAGFDDDWTKPLALELLASEVRQATRNAAARRKGDPPVWASTV